MTERMCMTATAPEADTPSSGPTVLWQARVPRPLAHDIEQDMQVLGLSSQSEAIREALRLLHGRAREVAMARDYDEFYGGAAAPLPDLVAELHSQE
jgi:Arc/MetJ-type ribon-helix-helix transcriptional regulator